MTPSFPAAPLAPAFGSLKGHASAYLVGIGGTGMCGAAELLRARGLQVGGSDRAGGARIDRLSRIGIRVDLEDGASPLPPGTSLVVASAAVAAAHPQLVEARRRGIPVWKYAECLGALMEGRQGIAVAGCHGKTTTSSLVAQALHRAGRDPSFVIGGEVRALASSARPGRGPHFVAEACEFDRSFHRLRPQVAIVTNLDADHLDYYRDMEEIRESFRDFARLLPEGGLLIVHEDHADTFRRDALRRARVETYGVREDADWRATDAWWDARDQVTRWRLARSDGTEALMRVPLAGHHNVLNATGAIAALVEAGLSLEEAAEGIAVFGGVGRRMERVAEAGGVLLLDDYGHHPTEIRAVIRAVRSRWDGRRVVVVFQPHQASRTRALLEGFGSALSEADEVWLPPIYFARDPEEERRRVSSEDVAARIALHGGKAQTFASLLDVVEHGTRALRPGDVVVTMGAGDVDEVARGLAARLR
jgi:UDP-N-acetylmuramate--alanine ligase